MQNLQNKTLKAISEVINQNQLENGYENFFDKLYSLVNFACIQLYYINFDRVNLQSFKFYNSQSETEPENFVEIDEKFISRIQTCDSFELDKQDEIYKIFKISHKFALLVPLKIKQTLFGFVLLERNERFDEAEIISINAFSSVLSYQIKDLELSEVFKMQLKALEENVNEKANAYKTIKKQNEQIMEADKAKNEFLANISHELRTPLNSIIGFSEVLQEEIFGSLNEKQKEYIKDIYVSGVHLLGMINEILDISKLESKAMSLNCSKFNYASCLNEVVNVIRPLAEKKNQQLVNKIDNDIEVEADRQKIQQILYNLLSNAIKFTPEKGKITIISKKHGKMLKTTVHDTGIGIDEKYQGKIFSKFVQLHSTYTKSESSTGLGLTITKELVLMHEGKIYLESKINEGSSFSFEIPLERNKNNAKNFDS